MAGPIAWIRNLFRRGENPQRFIHGIPLHLLEGLTLTDDQALSVSAIWGCINAIASPLAGANWFVYQPTGPHTRLIQYDDPLNWKLNTRPNPEMTAHAFREALLLQALVYGNSYAEIVPDRLGRPAQLWPLPSGYVFPRRDETWTLVFDVYGPDGALYTLPLDRVFHLHGPSLNGLVGEHMIGRAARTIALAAAEEKFAAGFFGRGATAAGFLKTKGKLSPTQVTLLQEDFKKKYAGLGGAHSVVALEDGYEFTPSTIDPQKAQLIEERKFSVEEVCRFYGVPLHKVQSLDRATFSNIEQQDLSFARDTLDPWKKRLEQEADAKLVGPRAPRQTCIDLRPLTQGDAAARASYYQSGIQNGWMSRNEARAAEGLDSAGPNGDVLLVNGTLTPVERVLAPPAPPPPGAPGRQQDDSSQQMRAVARDGLVLLVSGALERHRRRLDSRGEDRDKSFQRLSDELAPAMKFAVHALGRELGADDVARAARLVDSGALPADAALKALPA